MNYCEKSNEEMLSVDLKGSNDWIEKTINCHLDTIKNIAESIDESVIVECVNNIIRLSEELKGRKDESKRD
jgi:hypothetical protein